MVKKYQNILLWLFWVYLVQSLAKCFDLEKTVSVNEHKLYQTQPKPPNAVLFAATGYSKKNVELGNCAIHEFKKATYIIYTLHLKSSVP